MNARLLAYGIAWVGLLLAALWLAGDRLAVPWIVAGRSMEPALFHGDRVLVDLWTYRHRAPRAGELVLFEGPDGEVMVKRAAAPPPHAQRRPERWGQTGSETGGWFWLVGDNPSASRDSRRFGLVPRDRIRGRVVLRFRSHDKARRTPGKFL